LQIPYVHPPPLLPETIKSQRPKKKQNKNKPKKNQNNSTIYKNLQHSLQLTNQIKSNQKKSNL